MFRWVIGFILNIQNVDSIRGNFLNVSMVLGSIIKIKHVNLSGIIFIIFRWFIGFILNIQNVESIRGNFLNVSLGHRFHIKYSKCGTYQG